MSDFAYWLNVKGSALHLPQKAMPFGIAEQWGYEQVNKIKIAEYKKYPVFLLLDIDHDLDYISLRDVLDVDEEKNYLFHRAVGLQHFFQNQKFCGHCASAMTIHKDLIAVHCPKCHYLNFPRISPSIIVGIRKGNEILLAHHARHRNPIFTVLAGFVEMGETVEQAVHREVFEEIGLKIKNLQYIASQPWSFPNSLMLGFIAEYESGELVLQENEIKSAQWFDARHDLPVNIPEKTTIAHQLIQVLIEQIRAEEKGN